MKRVSLFFISLILGVNVFAGNLTPIELEDVFGSVRAELVRQICYIAEISDTTVLNNIENRSLRSFKAEYQKFYELEKDTKRKNELSQIEQIIKTLPSLSGDKVDEYVLKLNTAIANSISSLYENYPDSASDILSVQKRLSELLYFIIQELNREITADNRSECIIENAFACLDQQNQNDVNDNISDDQNLNQGEVKENSADSEHGCSKNLKRIIICIAFLFIASLGFWFYHQYFKHKPKHSDKQPQQMQHQDSILTVEPQHTSDSTTQQQKDPAVVVDVTKVRVAFAEQTKELSIVGASVIGVSHIQMNMPCQDYCGYEKLENGWGIAITSDGAGSAEHSEVGSKIVVERGLFHFKQRLLTKKWMGDNTLPTDAEWTQMAYYAFKSVYNDLNTVAEKNGKALSSLAATAIVLIHTPKGILVSHVGDGRAGYADLKGCWRSIIVPHKGEEANQTIFMTSDFWNIPNYVMSGVIVPESSVIRDIPSAFALMSDGCENNCWRCNCFDEKKQMYGDPNEPYDKFFTSICSNIESMRNANEHLDERKTKWANYLLSAGKFAKEPDDKTMIVGTLLY